MFQMPITPLNEKRWKNKIKQLKIILFYLHIHIHPYTNMKYILFPNMLGQLKHGVELSPMLLKEYMKLNSSTMVECNHSLEGNLYRLYKKNAKTVGKRINIGGDHSMSIATVAYTLNTYPKSKVIWIDAHPDINTSYSSTTQNVHGMPLGFLTGLDKNDNFPYIQNLLPFQNLLYVGIRDIDPFEQHVLNTCNIEQIDSEEVNNHPSKVIQKIRKFIGNDPFHLSFDVDSMDPSIMCSTGTPVEKGIMLKPMKKVLRNIMSSNNMVNMDITELNLELGNSKQSLNNLLYLFT